MNLRKPTLLLDPVICKRNIRAMAEKARKNDVIFRPHFKTHQSHLIGEWYREVGVDHITVSSMDMAEYFCGRFGHITVAIPFNILESDRLSKLISSGQKLAVLLDDPTTADILSRSVPGDLGIWIELDSGSHRSGLTPEKTDSIKELINLVERSDNLYLEGFYSHAGHSYNCRGAAEIRELYTKVRSTLLDLQTEQGGQVGINFGDTPCCSLVDDLSGFLSISPGNFVFYDVMQTEIGSCSVEDIAVCLACPVISKNRERNELVVYGGGIHLSKERMERNGHISYGLVVPITDDGWGGPMEGCELIKISQEHGVISVSDEVFNKYHVGDLVGILPVHSCMTADCMGGYLTTEGHKVDHMSSSKQVG